MAWRARLIANEDADGSPSLHTLKVQVVGSFRVHGD